MCHFLCDAVRIGIQGGDVRPHLAHVGKAFAAHIKHGDIGTDGRCHGCGVATGMARTNDQHAATPGTGQATQ